MAEAEAARLRLGDQDAALYGRAKRVAQCSVGQPCGRAEQRVPDLASGCCGQPQHGLCRVVEAGGTLQHQVAQSLRENHALAAGRSEKLFGEERVTFRAASDGVRQRCGQRMADADREHLYQLFTSERPKIKNERRTRAPNAISEAAHSRGGCGVVGPAGREQHNGPVLEIVREEDHEIERRGIGPVQILEHEQHGCGDGGLGQQRQRVLEHPAL